MRRNAPVVLTVASALLYAASFPPLDAFPLAWIALAPLVVASARSSVSRAALLGLLWGYLVCLLVGWPFAPMLSAHLRLPLWFGWLVFLVAAPALLGLYAGGFASWIAWTAPRGRASPLFVAAAWTGIEFLRHPLSAGIPWAFSGYTQMPWTTVAQAADLAGPFGLGFLLAAVNAHVAAAFVAPLRPRSPAVSRLALALSFVVIYGYGVWRLEGGPAERTVRVGLVQGGFGPLEAEERGSAAALDTYAELTESILAHDPALIVWPEFAIAFLPTQASRESLRLRQIAESTKAELILGGPHVDVSTSGDDIIHFNAVYLIREGRVHDRYDKERPLPVGERNVLGLRNALGLASYEPGRRGGVVDSEAGPIGIVICSEAMIPAISRERVREGATLLVNPSNDSWFGAEPAARQQLRIASMRAIESRRALVRPTPTGYSAVIDPEGREIARSALDRPATLVVDVPVGTGTSPYHRTGDVLPWLCLALALGAAVVPPRGTASEDHLPNSGSRSIQ